MSLAYREFSTESQGRDSAAEVPRQRETGVELPFVHGDLALSTSILGACDDFSSRAHRVIHNDGEQVQETTSVKFVGNEEYYLPTIDVSVMRVGRAIHASIRSDLCQTHGYYEVRCHTDAPTEIVMVTYSRGAWHESVVTERETSEVIVHEMQVHLDAARLQQRTELMEDGRPSPIAVTALRALMIQRGDA